MMMMMIRDVIITLSITVLVLNLHVVQVQEVDLGRREQSLFSGVSARLIRGRSEIDPYQRATVVVSVCIIVVVCLIVVCLSVCVVGGAVCLFVFVFVFFCFLLF